MDDRLKEARKRAKKKKDFYSGLVAYGITIPFLFVINVMSYNGHLWFIYPALGWGVALAFQYWELFGQGHFSAEWEERQVEKELEAMDREYGSAKDKPEDALELRELQREREKAAKWNDQDLV